MRVAHGRTTPATGGGPIADSRLWRTIAYGRRGAIRRRPALARSRQGAGSAVVRRVRRGERNSGALRVIENADTGAAGDEAFEDIRGAARQTGRNGSVTVHVPGPVNPLPAPQVLKLNENGALRPEPDAISVLYPASTVVVTSWFALTLKPTLSGLRWCTSGGIRTLGSDDGSPRLPHACTQINHHCSGNST